MDKFEGILRRMEETYERESGCKIEDVSDVGLRMRALAGELYRLEASMEWLERQAFPQTATGKQLDLHGAQRGVLRKQAEKAAGVVSFSRYLPLSFDLVVPKGTVCATSGEPVVEYATTEEAVLQAGELTVDVPVEAVVPGAAGNAAAGYVTTLVGAPVGINYAANESPITGGQDPEEDEAYRKRILDAWAHSPNGTNADYYREIALNREGITSVQVVPRSSGAGTVALYLWGEDSAPSNDTIAALKADLDAQREVGVTVTVQAARAVQVSVLVNIQLSEELDLEQAKADIEAALREFFKGLGVGDGYLLTDISRVVLSAVPVEKLEFPSTMRDVPSVKGGILRLSNVIVGEIA